MQHQIVVSFSKDTQYVYKFDSSTIGATQDEARLWFNKEFQDLGCNVATPTGKVLIVDRILSVAKYAGEQRFSEQTPWAEHFVRYAALILGREVIRVDVGNYAIGY